MRILQTPQGFLIVDPTGRPVAGPYPDVQSAVQGLRTLPPQPLPPAPGTPQPQQAPPPMPQGPGPQMVPAQAPGLPPGATSLAQARPPQGPPPQPMPQPPTGPQGPVMMPGAEPPRPPASLASFRPDDATAARISEMNRGAIGPDMPRVTINPDGSRVVHGQPPVPDSGPIPGQAPTSLATAAQPQMAPGSLKGVTDPGQAASIIEKMVGPEKWAQTKAYIQSKIAEKQGGGQGAQYHPTPQPGPQPTEETPSGQPDIYTAGTKPPSTMGLVPLKDYLEQKKSMGAVPGQGANAIVPSDEVPGRPSLPSDEVPNKPPTSLGSAYMQMAQAKKPDAVDQMLERAEKGQTPAPQDKPSYFRNSFGGKKTPPAAPKEKTIDQMTDDEIIQKILKEQQQGGKKSSRKEGERETVEVASTERERDEVA